MLCILCHYMYFGLQSCPRSFPASVPCRRGCHPQPVHPVPLRAVHRKRKGSDADPGSHAHISNWCLFNSRSTTGPKTLPLNFQMISIFFAGRVVAGWVCDRSWLHPISIASLSTIIVLVPLFSLAFCTSFTSFIICTSLYGWLTGCWIAVMSPIFVRLLGLQLLSPAFSFLTAVRGLATLSGPPLAGALVDKFQDK